jgi:lipopolysaccharide transport system ATP-binding protein
MRTVVQIEKVSKAYHLGQINTGTLSLDLQRWWALKRGKEDPFLKIGETNDRTSASESNIVWSLKDIDFDINEGDSLGIIGRNGAGKSTLLKLLSRITAPTTGSIRVKGKMASLLEVGTGFHPELSGRENIFLNGAILGMRNLEIKHKLEEIIDFSGVERYIDTPVKRYSSGMYVRLAFAVAAHLDSDILIVDEVLAVGDAEFQKKCLGKMNELGSKSGRTIVFVSHNMTSIKALCNKSIVLDKGRLIDVGSTNEVVKKYLDQGMSDVMNRHWDGDSPSANGIRLQEARIYAKDNISSNILTTRDDLVIEFDFINEIGSRNIDITIDIFDSNLVHVTHFGMICNPVDGLTEGLFRTQGFFPGNLLNSNRYIFNITFGLNQREVLLKYDEVLIVDIEDDIKTRGNNFSKLPGVIHPIIDWITNKVTN